MKYIVVDIKKPIFDTYVGIREKYIWQAKRQGKKLLVKIPQGQQIVSPDKWLKDAERIEKVFLRPDEPMVLYANYVKPDKVEKPEENFTVATSVWERLREMGVEKKFR